MQDILNQYVDQYFDRMVEDLRQLIQIDSTLDESTATQEAPFGQGVKHALGLAQKQAQDLGFATKDVDGYAVYAQLGDAGEQVGILAHMDVVPAAGEWKYPPYAAQIADGKMYGRGTMDDKGPMISCLYAMKAILESKLPYRNHVRLIMGGDEETGMRCLKHYLKKEPAPAYGFSPDANFPIIYAEKGIIQGKIQIPLEGNHCLTMEGGSRCNIVPDLAKATVYGKTKEELEKAIAQMEEGSRFTLTQEGEGVTICSTGLAAHAMEPHKGYNAIQHLLRLLDRVGLEHAGVAQMVHTMAESLAMETDGATVGIACSDDVAGPLTLNLAIVDIKEDSAVFSFDIRYPVLHKGEDILEKVEAFAKKLQGTFVLGENKKPLYVEQDRPFIRNLQQSYEEFTGEKAELLAIGGGTYCRCVPNTVSFGAVFPGQPELAHQANEYVDLEQLRKMTKLYAQAIYNLIK